jgi:hypothetical protein
VFLGRAYPSSRGAIAELNRQNSTVTLRNTPQILDKMERELGPMDGGGVFYEERIQ